MKRLVAYFSASKTTEKVANMIAEEGGYDIVRLLQKRHTQRQTSTGWIKSQEAASR